MFVRPEQMEERRTIAAIEFGGFALVVAIWTLALPTIVPWISPPILGIALVLVSTSVMLLYRKIVLCIPVSNWLQIPFLVLSTIAVITAISDASLRQNHRYGDCLNLEQEIVTSSGSKRADASNAFQALRCTPSGGLIERWKGVSHEDEQRLRDMSPLS